MKDFLSLTIIALLLINGCVSGGAAVKEQSFEEETIKLNLKFDKQRQMV